uniref:Putative secreted protein n=1 Tax=Anopheles darlingi TaxID=43151 RepID=A0A2M4DBI5_ANODA
MKLVFENAKLLLPLLVVVVVGVARLEYYCGLLGGSGPIQHVGWMDLNELWCGIFGISFPVRLKENRLLMERSDAEG